MYNVSSNVRKNTKDFTGRLFLSYSPSVDKQKSSFACICSTNNNSLLPSPYITYHTDYRYKTMKTTASDNATLSPIWLHFFYNTWPREMQLNKVWSNLDLTSDLIRIICGVALQRCRKWTWPLVSECAESVSICLVISKLPPKETHIAFYISKEITLQYVAVVLCQGKSQSFLLASSEAGLHAAPV